MQYSRQCTVVSVLFLVVGSGIGQCVVCKVVYVQCDEWRLSAVMTLNLWLTDHRLCGPVITDHRMCGPVMADHRMFASVMIDHRLF